MNNQNFSRRNPYPCNPRRIKINFIPIFPRTKFGFNHFALYKSVITKYVNWLNLCGQFAWQERFYDHIICDEEECQRIENYIQNNPGNWKEDKFFS